MRKIKKIHTKSKPIPEKSRPNLIVLAIGLIIITISYFIGKSINNNRLALENGVLVSAPISKIIYGRQCYGEVKINNDNLEIRILDDNLNIGDSILVRYDKDKSLAVQEKFTDGYFVLWFILDGILLTFGILFCYAGIMGKKMTL